MLSLNKMVSKFVAKLLKNRILFKDINTFLELDYRQMDGLTLKIEKTRF